MVSLGVVLRSKRPLVGTFHADPSRMVRRMYRWGRAPLQRVVSRIQVATAVSDVAAEAILPFAEPRLIPNAVDASAFPTTERHDGRVVFVGRDEPRKGLDVFVEAWAAVSARHPAAEAIVISDADRPPVPGIRFMGTVDAEEKARLLASSSVLIAPNLGGESFGLVVAEGMAAGCAVVASGLAAFAAVLGDTGVLCKPGDAAAFADAISELLGDPGRARGLGERARERAMAFDIGTVGPRYEEAYGDAVAADRSEPRR
jgi:phosphatidylinositol alpha-mannosyltransferase